MTFGLRTFLLTVTACLPQFAFADTLTVREDNGNLVTIDAKIIGNDKGVFALERRDGHIELIPHAQIFRRVPNDGPAPMSCQEIKERLTEEFGEELFRTHIEEPFVIGLVLSERLPKSSEPLAARCLKEAASFMKEVEKYFTTFSNDLKIKTQPSRFPLVLIIFETDDDFKKFATKDTGGKGLSADSMFGYYNGLSNRLVIRMSECHSKSTPLHEAIHQQAFNRGIMNRLAPVPAWFGEGMATGFEVESGNRIAGGPFRINKRYARRALASRTVNWDTIVTDNKPFYGDDLAGEAYAHAWSMHWFLLTKYKKQYVEYLQLISEKETLQLDPPEKAKQEFEDVMGKSIDKLQAEFPKWLDSQCRKKSVSLTDRKPAGHLVKQINLAEVEINAIKSNLEHLETDGRLINLSQIRAMSFLVTVETNTGTYAQWYLPKIDPQKGSLLPKQLAEKRMKDAPNRGSETTVWIRVQSAVPESETGQAWKRGEFPVPTWSPQ